MRPPPTRPAVPKPAAPKPGSDAAADRLDAMLEQRFSGSRDAMARQLAEYDRKRAQAAPAAPVPGKLLAPTLKPPSMVQGKPRVRFAGAVPPQLQEVLKEWLPALHEFGTRIGLGFISANLEFHVFDRAAYQAAHGTIPQGVALPASSYQFNAVYRNYVVRLVLPPAVQTLDHLLAVARTLLTRLYGDVFLREEVYSLAPYKEDEPVEGPSVGLAEQIQVLASLRIASSELDKTLAGFAQDQGLNFRRTPDAVRKAFFTDLERRAEHDDMPAGYLALVESVFGGFLKELKADLPRAIGEHIAAVEELNRQVSFLPPHEWPGYAQLKTARPVHYLRAAKLRLEFTIEALAALAEDFEALEDVARTPSPLLEERIQGFLQSLEAQHLARPYLVPDARLSDELISKLNGFPLEVHAVLIQLPPMEDKQKQFDMLAQRMRNALHQRLYHALVLLRHAIRQREAGKAAAFRSSPGYQTLRGYAANFRLRLPILRSLFARLGFVVDLAEAAGLELGSSAHVRFPEQAFTRAWGQFAAHAVAAGWLTARRQKGFDPARYWEQVDAGLRDGLRPGASLSPAAAAQGRIVYLLRRYHQRTGEPGLHHLVGQLKGSLGTFRFAIYQASQPGKPPQAGADAPSQEAALEGIVAALWEARQGQEKHALEVGADGKLR